jgi:hypothetical protein
MVGVLIKLLWCFAEHILLLAKYEISALCMQALVLSDLHFYKSQQRSECNKTFLGYFYTKTNQMYQFLKFILLWNNTLHVLGGLSVHHQELGLYIQQQLYVKQILLLHVWS